jgi:uncharacterized protein
MRIGIFGSSGFIGKNLVSFLSQQFEVISFARNDLDGDIKALAEKICNLDVIINLVGAPIVARRWTKKYREVIINSRVSAIIKIKEALQLNSNRPGKFICASAVGIYAKPGYNDEYDNNYANDFLANVAKQWEDACIVLEDLVSKIIILRFGIVLGVKGGVLKQMTKIYSKHIATIIGKQDSLYPYISVNDLQRGILFLIKNNESKGVYNFVEPTIITNKQFTVALANVFNTKIWISIPESLIKFFVGERADVLFAGQHVVPKRLLNLGFDFQDYEIDKFLKQEIKKG